MKFNSVEEMHVVIGKNVKKLREKRGLSQQDLSLAIGQNSTTIISQAELGKKKHFNLEHLYLISNVLDCDICDFFHKDS